MQLRISAGLGTAAGRSGSRQLLVHCFRPTLTRQSGLVHQDGAQAALQVVGLEGLVPAERDTTAASCSQWRPPCACQVSQEGWGRPG